MEKMYTVSVFDGVTTKTPLHEIGLTALLAEIKSGKYQAQISEIRAAFDKGDPQHAQFLKKKLLAFTSSGTFHLREKRELKDHSGIICLDYDNLPNEAAIRNCIENDPHTFACFRSPSGNGLKVFVKVNVEPSNHMQAFKQADEYYFGVTSLRSDPTCKDVSRLCFVSDDPHLYMNENSITMMKSAEMGQSEWEEKLKKTKDFTEKKIKFADGSRNDFVHLFSCNANRFGIPFEKTVQYSQREFLEHDFKEDEISATVKSGYSKIEDFGSYKTEIEAKPSLGMTVMDLVGQPKYLTHDMFIWGGIVQPSVGFIFGLSKVGKTTLSESLAFALALGRESFLDQKIQKQKRVLLISLEEYIELRRDRLAKQISALSKDEKEILAKNLLINTADFPQYLTTDKDFELLEEYIRDLRPDVVIIDSLSHIRPGTSIEDSTSASELMKIFKELANQFKIAIILIHHTVKAVADGIPVSLSTMAGSRILSQEAEFMYGVNSTPSNQRYLKVVNTRYKEGVNREIVFSINDQSIVEFKRYDTEQNLLRDFDGRTDRTNYNLIFEYIQAEKEVNTSQLVGEFVDSQIMTKPTMYENLDKLESDGKIVKPVRGLFKIAA